MPPSAPIRPCSNSRPRRNAPLSPAAVRPRSRRCRHDRRARWARCRNRMCRRQGQAAQPSRPIPATRPGSAKAFSRSAITTARVMSSRRRAARRAAAGSTARKPSCCSARSWPKPPGASFPAAACCIAAAPAGRPPHADAAIGDHRRRCAGARDGCRAARRRQCYAAAPDTVDSYAIAAAFGTTSANRSFSAASVMRCISAAMIVPVPVGSGRSRSAQAEATTTPR